MPVNPPFTVYRDQLSSLYHGLALWKPNPPRGIYDRVSIGDVGYVREGVFIRMFNVILPWDHQSNKILGEPVPYESLSCGPFANILEDLLERGEYYSRHVSTEANAGSSQAITPDDAEGVTYKCRSRGALLSLPHGGHRRDFIRKKTFEDYIRDHVVSWFTWTQDNKLGIERIEELILVSGCTLATSWAVAAFVDDTMEEVISLASRPGDNGRANFIWNNIRGPVQYRNSHFDPENPPIVPDQCVFIRGFRAKRILFWTRPIQAAAEPLPDDRDNHSDDEIQVTEVPGVPKYRDPLIGVLDYIVEKCLEDTIPEDTIAIAHDDDLELIKDVETLTADAIEMFLHEKKLPLCVENGAAILFDSRVLEKSSIMEQNLVFPISVSSSRSPVPFATSSSLVSQDIVPVIGITDVSGIAIKLKDIAENVKVYRSQCEHLSKQCLDLASALRDNSDKLDDTAAQQAADEAERILIRILNRVREWADLSRIKSIIKQTEIKLGIDESYRELDACSMRFNITLHLNASSRSSELEEIRRRDHEELVEMIRRILHDNNLLKITLATSTQEDAHNVVEAIAQELSEADMGETQGRQLQEDLGQLRTWVEGLPPMDDLSGKVTRTSDHPIASGGSQDIYTGEWSGQEVVLAYPRNQSRAGRERFQKQVEIWRTLRHPSILQLLGIASIGDFIYSVSPYMAFCHVTRFLKAHPDADRILLLREIAFAAEYLHVNGIIHGDLQGSNVLISRDGHAFLSDLGSARAEDVPVTDAIPYGSLRWLAPELVADHGYTQTTRATDVWSFGMLSLEIFTDNVPFSHVSNEAFIPLAIRDGPLPTRPEGANTRGLSDVMWDLMNECWQRDPTSRPSMSETREAIQNLHSMRSPSRPRKSSISNALPDTMHRSMSGVRGDVRPSGLTLSMSPKPPAPMPKYLARDELKLEQTQRGYPASSPMRNTPIPDPPLSSSPLSGLALGPLAVPGKVTPHSQTPSPLSSNFWTPPPSTWHESRTSASGGSLEAAVQDTEPLLRRTADGTVEAGTLVGLIDHLIKDTHGRAKDDEFRRVFLATYPLFMTGEDLFRSLRRRFEEMGDLQSFIPSKSSRYSILLVLRTWLEGGGEQWSRGLLSSIREFARSISGSDTMKASMKDIANIANEKMNVVVVSPTLSFQVLPGTTLPPSSLEHFKPKDIAGSLSVIEGEFYSKITQADYIAHVRGTPITTHIASVIKINDRLANWVKLQIIRPKDVNRRSTKFRHFVLIAENCKKSHNFLSMSAIVRALQSLSQLVLTCDIELTKKEKQLLAQLGDILSPERDHLAYRQALQNIEPSIIIPWLAVHLRSLQTFYDDSSSTVIIDQRPQINFIRCAELIQRIGEIRRYHQAPQPAPPVDPQAGKTKDRWKIRAKTKDKDKDKGRSSGPVAAALAWVKNELDNAPSAISLERFEAFVSELAQAERQSHKRHEPMLRSLGYAQPTLAPRHRPISPSSSSENDVAGFLSLEDMT